MRLIIISLAVVVAVSVGAWLYLNKTSNEPVTAPAVGDLQVRNNINSSGEEKGQNTICAKVLSAEEASGVLGTQFDLSLKDNVNCVFFESKGSKYANFSLSITQDEKASATYQYLRNNLTGEQVENISISSAGHFIERKAKTTYATQINASQFEIWFVDSSGKFLVMIGAADSATKHFTREQLIALAQLVDKNLNR